MILKEEVASEILMKNLLKLIRLDIRHNVTCLHQNKTLQEMINLKFISNL